MKASPNYSWSSKLQLYIKNLSVRLRYLHHITFFARRQVKQKYFYKDTSTEEFGNIFPSCVVRKIALFIISWINYRGGAPFCRAISRKFRGSTARLTTGAQ